MMSLMLLICCLLLVMSYFSATENSFQREYIFQYHDFATPFFFLGIEHNREPVEEQKVTVVRVGLVFIQILIYTYKHNEATLQQYPWLKGVGMCIWQKWIIAFFYSLDLPVYRSLYSDDME